MRKNQWVAKTPNGYYITIDRTSSNKHMLGTNEFNWHQTLDAELEWDIFGTKQELEKRLKTFAAKYEINLFWLNADGKETLANEMLMNRIGEEL